MFTTQPSNQMLAVDQALAVSGRAIAVGNRAMVAAHAAAVMALADLADLVRVLAARVDVRDERGDIEARTVTIAVMAALAVAVGVIITDRVTNRANSISLD